MIAVRVRPIEPQGHPVRWEGVGEPCRATCLGRGSLLVSGPVAAAAGRYSRCPAGPEVGGSSPGGQAYRPGSRRGARRCQGYEGGLIDRLAARSHRYLPGVSQTPMAARRVGRPGHPGRPDLMDTSSHRPAQTHLSPRHTSPRHTLAQAPSGRLCGEPWAGSPAGIDRAS